MTDAERVMILLTAIRCILSLNDIPKGGLRLKLIKSVLLEAVQQCGRGGPFAESPDVIAMISAIEEEVAMKEAAQ